MAMVGIRTHGRLTSSTRDGGPLRKASGSICLIQSLAQMNERFPMLPSSSTPENGPSEDQLAAASATFDLLSVPGRLHLVWLLSRDETDVTTLAARTGAQMRRPVSSSRNSVRPVSCRPVARAGVSSIASMTCTSSRSWIRCSPISPPTARSPKPPTRAGRRGVRASFPPDRGNGLAATGSRAAAPSSRGPRARRAGMPGRLAHPRRPRPRAPPVRRARPARAGTARSSSARTVPPARARRRR